MLRAGDPRTAPSGSASLELRAGVEHTDYVFLRKIRCTGRVSHRAGEPTYPVPSSTPVAVISHLREGTVSSTGDNALARKESDRGTLSHVALPRTLQYNLLGSQERPVFDLKLLNHFVRKKKFKMTTSRVVTIALHHGDWIVSVDLKDIYFHIPIHRKYTAIDACSALPQQGTTGSESFNSEPCRSV